MSGTPVPGSVVAGYRLVSVLGEGATGVVYLAEREGTDERVALKLLAPALARDERFRQRLLRESELARGLEHAHVVPVLDVGTTDAGLYLAMRYVPGADLREILAREGPLEPARALALLGSVADALDHAHERGLIHRDVKPANILVERDGDHESAFLADFGLAKHASSASSLTGEHAFVGTIAYVSPEQIRGEQLDGRADVYSLACVLYECLAGAPPFDRESELAVVYAHLHERVPPLGDVRPGLPDALDDVLRQGTAKDPADRHRTCRAMIDDARAALAGERRRRRRPALWASLAGVALLAAVAVGAILLAKSDESTPSGPAVDRLPVGGSGIGLIRPSDGRVAGRVHLPDRPSDLVFADRRAWTILPGAERVAVVSTVTRRAVGGVALPFAPGGLAAAGRAVFVTEQGGPGVVRIDTATRRITARWTVPPRGFRISNPTGIAAGAGSVWLARGADVVRIDARTGRIRHRYPLPVTATLLAFAGGKLWGVSSEDGLVEAIDPVTDRIVARARLHGWVSALTVAAGSVWAAVIPDDVVFRLSTNDASVQGTVPAGDDPESLAPLAGTLWVADATGRALTGIDMRSGRRRSVPLAGAPQLIRGRRGVLWTVAAEPPPVLRAAATGPVIRVASSEGDSTADPASLLSPSTATVLRSTCAGLVAYREAAGRAGQELIPDAAAALPQISPDRRTYTFHIRPGLRFSPPSGAPVTAAAFRREIERLFAPAFAPEPAGPHVAGDFVGAAAVAAGRARHLRGVVAQGNTLSITLVRPAGDLLSRLALTFFCAVPPGTPAPTRVAGPVPSAGPYYVRAQLPGTTVLDRNPGYHGTRLKRPARIVALTNVPTSRSLALAGAGRVDYLPWDFDLHGPLVPGGALARHPGRGLYRVAPAPGIDLIAFNTNRALFRDARLRRAVNLALDRPALAAVFAERPTDRYLPPAVPGSGGPAVYPLAGPDLAAARRLLHHPPARTARLYYCGEADNQRVAEIVRADLRPLGLDVTIVPSLGCLRGPDPKLRTADLVLQTWSTQELDPAPYLDAAVGDTAVLGGQGGPPTWRDPGFRASVVRARLLPAGRRLAVYARLEHQMLRGPAPYAAYGAFTAPEYLSARTGCRLVQGAYHTVDLAALCLRSGARSSR